MTFDSNDCLATALLRSDVIVLFDNVGWRLQTLHEIRLEVGELREIFVHDSQYII